MDFQFWLIVIIAVISLLSRLGKKKEASPEPKPRNPDRPGNPDRYKEVNRPVATERPKQMTFEELLREITEAKQKPTPPPPPALAPERRVPEVVDYDEDLGDEVEDLEVVQVDTRRQEEEASRKRYQTEYDAAKRQSFARASLEETLKLADTKIQFGKFKAFEHEQQRNLLKEYTKDLKSPDGLKKAFVLTEILNRKF
jgi:hypothetical protein